MPPEIDRQLPEDVSAFAKNLEDQLNKLLRERGKKSSEDSTHLENILRLFAVPLINTIQTLDDSNPYLIEISYFANVQKEEQLNQQKKSATTLVHTRESFMDLTIPIPDLANEHADLKQVEPLTSLLVQLMPMFSKIVTGSKISVRIK